MLHSKAHQMLRVMFNNFFTKLGEENVNLKRL